MHSAEGSGVCTGPTPPLSSETSSVEEASLSIAYERVIETTKESKEEGQLRERVLSWLDDMVKKFVSGEAVRQGYRQEDARQLGGRIYTFGSYRLGVHSPGADIDTLCLVPRHVSREAFFKTLHDDLRKDPKVTELVPVPDATVPVMKLKVSGISIDLLFSCLDVASIPNTFEITEDEVLKGVDDQTQRSLNGTRVATKMLRCVPAVHTFRSVLRGVKKWANARGVYGNIYGYPGGVAYAILVARVCQLYPNMSAGSVFLRFFTFYSVWWKADVEPPTHNNNPIYLTKTLDLDKGYGFPVWNRRLNQRNRFDIFPVITPCYPYMNACYNCTKTNLRVLVAEFERGRKLADAAKKAGGDADFAPFFDRTDFFLKYPTYLLVTATAANEDDGRKWRGYLESRLKRLLMQLDIIQGLGANLLPACFERPVSPPGSSPEAPPVFSYSWFIGLDPSTSTEQNINLDKPWAFYLSVVTVQSTFARTEAMGDPSLDVLKRKDLLSKAAFAVPEEDRAALAKILAKQRKEKKRKREVDGSNNKASPGGKSQPSPAIKPCSSPGTVPERVSSSTPSPKRAATPKKKSLTDQLLADSFGY